MNKDKLKRYIDRIKQNLDDIEGKTDRVDILAIADVAKENLKEIKREVEK